MDNAVDGLDKASIANSDGPTTGSQTPPFKRKGKLSTIGKIFKPWKWRKKKTSDKFRETSAVLERKISTRQSREELIRRGVLKELPDQDGDVTVNFENSNGHMISIGEETIQEENVVKSEEGNDSVSAKATSLEEKAEDKKGEPMLGSSPRGYLEVIGRSYLWTLRENPENCSETSTVPVPAPPPPKPKPKPKPKKTTAPPKGATAVGSHKGDEAPAVKKNAKTPSKQPPVPPPKPTSRNVNREAASSSHLKKTTVSKSASSPSTSSSSSSRPKAAKEPASSKTGIVGTTRGKKKTGKQSATRTPTDGAASGIANTSGDHLDIKEEKLKLEQTLPTAEEQNSDDQQSQPVVPPPPIAPPPPPPPPTLPLSRTNQCSLSLDTPVVTINSGGGPPSSGLDSTHPLWTEEPANITTVPSDSGLDVSRERVKCLNSLTTKEELVKETPCLVIPVLMGETFSTSRAEGHRESQTNDSDSDGPILYTDDEDDDDEDDTSGESTLASKIRRRDTLAIKLGNRPSKKELEDKNILQRTSEEERQEIRQQIGTKLVRRLSQRPTTEELEQRNILKQKNEEEEQEAKMELKRRLSRKLSLRPTVAELQARRILRFNEYVEVSDSPDYDRRADKPWARLTPADKAAIRKELNEFKSTEMEVHEESRQFTRFHRP
ncbi:phosphatase and actin regulator 2 isoform X2 [Ornithorhynchus anatinus]|uniref:phosphatase and actin regulator 2 isoform X2 n=1 Tax=Ornithorhynchus anatinus TaxID=9258 RepID=UPI0019D4AABB|nr:phosphatase and actin regulator 2 isoform X2 [Ornithorhynchus anatinus]